MRKSKNLWSDLAKEIADKLKKPESEKEIEQTIKAFVEERIIKYFYTCDKDEELDSDE